MGLCRFEYSKIYDVLTSLINNIITRHISANLKDIKKYSDDLFVHQTRSFIYEFYTVFIFLKFIQCASFKPVT